MIQISKEEFEKCIEELIERKITKVKLAKELKTDSRTLDCRIQELSATNPELYKRYVEALPYKKKKRDHIDFEALLIYMLKQQMTIPEVALKFDISERTIRRRINEMENKELVDLYREVADNRKHAKKDSLEITSKIDELVERTIILHGVNETREQELMQIEEKYNKLCENMTKEEAARTLGIGGRDRAFKLLNELYKIKIEKEHTQKNDFKEGLKVDVVQVKPVENHENETENRSLEEEGR